MSVKTAFFTNDVETTSLWNHVLSDSTGKVVMNEGMPLLLDIYQKYNIKSTFFFTAYIARLYPKIVKMIIPYGHEVASHGLVHDSDKAFDVLSFAEQINHLTESKKILEDISQKEVISFRAPALRVNKYTPQALTETGFKIDSSVAPQRMDMFMSFGAVNKLNWFRAPRMPYYTRQDNLTRKGKGPIFEIPVSSFALPYTGTFMRVSPSITKTVRTLLNLEAEITNHPINFIIHPNELIEEEIINSNINRRAKNYLSYLLGDKLRYKLKLKNLGRKAAPLLDNQVNYLDKKKFRFITLKQYFTEKDNKL